MIGIGDRQSQFILRLHYLLILDLIINSSVSYVFYLPVIGAKSKKPRIAVGIKEIIVSPSLQEFMKILLVALYFS